MKAIILAGGVGSRLSEETNLKPKPMVEIGGKPILWHIIKIFSANGITDFIICLGYKGYIIKEYFANYFLHSADVVFDLQKNTMEVLNHSAEPWRITLIDTGIDTMTGGRIRRVIDYVDDEDTFCMTYGDGLANIDVRSLIDVHEKEGRLATVTAVRPPGRFGSVEISNNKVVDFREKPRGGQAWINGGFFVLSKEVVDYIKDDTISWEREPMEMLAKSGQLSAYTHHGFWQAMDTLREKNYLEELWQAGDAPWMIWR